MSRTLRNRKRPDSVRMPSVPGMSKNPNNMGRSTSAGPHAARRTCHEPDQLKQTPASSTQSTPALNKKYLEKIPSISAKSESSDDDDDDDDENSPTKNERNGEDKKNDDEDDDDSDRDPLRKRSSVIKHEYINTTDWPPSRGSCGGISIVSNGSIQTRNISTKMASGMRACKATGRNIIRMLSSASPTSSRRNSKTSASLKSNKENTDYCNLKLNKVMYY